MTKQFYKSALIKLKKKGLNSIGNPKKVRRQSCVSSKHAVKQRILSPILTSITLKSKLYLEELMMMETLSMISQGPSLSKYASPCSIE